MAQGVIRYLAVSTKQDARSDEWTDVHFTHRCEKYEGQDDVYQFGNVWEGFIGSAPCGCEVMVQQELWLWWRTLPLLKRALYGVRQTLPDAPAE